jgi:hypothetical protein
MRVQCDRSREAGREIEERCPCDDDGNRRAQRNVSAPDSPSSSWWPGECARCFSGGLAGSRPSRHVRFLRTLPHYLRRCCSRLRVRAPDVNWAGESGHGALFLDHRPRNRCFALLRLCGSGTHFGDQGAKPPLVGLRPGLLRVRLSGLGTAPGTNSGFGSDSTAPRYRLLASSETRKLGVHS